MRVENPEKALERLRDDLAGARAKAVKWQRRVTELEEQVTEKENLLILRAVRSVAASPEELRGLLDQIKAANGQSIVPGAVQSNVPEAAPVQSDAEGEVSEKEKGEQRDED